MKKITITILSLFLMGCQNNTSVPPSTDEFIEESIESVDVFVESEKVDAIKVDDHIYMDVEALESVGLDVLINPDGESVYVTELNQHLYVNNDQHYSWYIDQEDTGKHAENNCGPTSVVMAGLWQDDDFDITAEEARDDYRSNGGWWYTDDVEDFLEKYNVDFELKDYHDEYELVETLNEGNIILLCIDTSYLSYSDDDYTGRFYSYEGGHFLIVKGYQYIDRALYFQVYDPNGWSEVYQDGSPKGKDRLYLGEELSDAILNWWDEYFIILK